VLVNAHQRAFAFEASTEGEWVARWLESLNHDVMVADPYFAPMYAPLASDEGRSARCADADASFAASRVHHEQ
jgi:hypothetical protein